jgi:hypothetical protein
MTDDVAGSGRPCSSNHEPPPDSKPSLMALGEDLCQYRLLRQHLVHFGFANGHVESINAGSEEEIYHIVVLFYLIFFVSTFIISWILVDIQVSYDNYI